MLRKRHGIYGEFSDPISLGDLGTLRWVQLVSLDWGKLPDVGAVALLTCAFASVARRCFTAVSGLWLTGWLLIELHFAAFMFLPLRGDYGVSAGFIGLAALVWAGMTFIWACVPYRADFSSRCMVAALVIINTIYVGLLCFAPAGYWAL